MMSSEHRCKCFALPVFNWTADVLGDIPVREQRSVLAAICVSSYCGNTPGFEASCHLIEGALASRNSYRRFRR